MKKLTKELQEIKRLKRVIRSLSDTAEHLNQRIIDKEEIIKYLMFVIKNQDHKIKGLQTNASHQ